ncbi:MAG: hypothetical protein C4570_00820 [Ammonifex sp.]|nr:MAG: hypothetical protein C4570_00820 [Ammonifex sp.]
MIFCGRIFTFLSHKMKLKVRRRYSILEKLLFRFRFSKALFEKLYLATFALDVLGSTGVALAVYLGLQQVSFTTASSYGSWQWFYFALLLFGCFKGLQVSGRTLFPEDLQLLGRLPLSQKQLSFFVFAEHLSSTAFSILLLVIVPIGIPLLLTTEKYISGGMALLTTILMTLLALMMGFLTALLLRLLRFRMLKHGTFWKTLLSQMVFSIVVGTVSYGLTIYALGYFAEWLRRIPLGIFTNGDLEQIAQWLNLGITHLGEFIHTVSALFQYSFWPFNSAAGMTQEFSLSHLGLILLTMFAVFLPTALVANHFKGYFLADVPKTQNPVWTDQWIYNALNRLKPVHSAKEILFRKNLLLILRHLEIVHSAGPGSLFGGTGIWILAGILGGAGKVFSGTPFASGWQLFMTVPVMVLLLATLQARVFYDLRFLLSIDGEGRNVSLLRLAKVYWADLFVCRVRLLRVVTLPALLSFVLMLGIFSQWAFEYCCWSLLSALFIYVNLPQVLLLSSIATPHFETAHFEESGEFFEQKLSDEGSWVIFLLVSWLVPFVCFGLMVANLLSFTAYVTVLITWYGLVTTAVHLIGRGMVDKLGFKIKQAEEVL